MMSAWDLHKAWPEAEFKVNVASIILSNTICHSYVKNWDLLTRDLP
jgi:hypothetical protein